MPLVDTKIVNCVEDALWLATQTPNILCFHLQATHVGFKPEYIVIVAGINELKSSFCGKRFHCFSFYTKTTIHRSVGKYFCHYKPLHFDDCCCPPVSSGNIIGHVTLLNYLRVGKNTRWILTSKNVVVYRNNNKQVHYQGDQKLP